MLDGGLLRGDAAIGLDHGFVEICAAVGLQRCKPFRDPFAFAYRAKRQCPIPCRVKAQEFPLDPWDS